MDSVCLFSRARAGLVLPQVCVHKQQITVTLAVRPLRRLCALHATAHAQNRQPPRTGLPPFRLPGRKNPSVQKGLTIYLHFLSYKQNYSLPVNRKAPSMPAMRPSSRPICVCTTCAECASNEWRQQRSVPVWRGDVVCNFCALHVRMKKKTNRCGFLNYRHGFMQHSGRFIQPYRGRPRLTVLGQNCIMCAHIELISGITRTRDGNCMGRHYIDSLKFPLSMYR